MPRRQRKCGGAEQPAAAGRRCLRPKELAEQYGIPVRTSENWRNTGLVKLPFVKLGGIVLYPVDEMEKFLRDRLVTSTSQLPARRGNR